MSDTPRTDAAYKDHPWDMHDHIPLEFCRQLERELAEAKAALAKVHKDLGHELRDPNGTIWDECARLRRELAETKDALREYMQAWDARMLPKETFDKACKVLAQVEGGNDE